MEEKGKQYGKLEWKRVGGGEGRRGIEEGKGWKRKGNSRVSSSGRGWVEGRVEEG